MILLEYRGVAKDYGGLRAIDDVSFRVEEGEIVGLIGPNGAGKTTLFELASGFQRPTRGEIWFAGKRIDGLGTPVICAMGLARTFQVVRPFGEMTVLENVLVGAFLRSRHAHAARTRAASVLKDVQMTGRDAQIARTLTLAGRKRLEVAKALATAPRLLLLDEVMAGLTRVETAEIMAMVRDVRQSGITILMVEHNMHAVMALSDRVVVLHHGRKICEGTPAEVGANSGVVEAYLGEREIRDA
ncbi:MAG: ABC transporter ATP-binding protein [Burkholderiaceae bacterium]|nr:ABC transporter ATP-binding protein [Burkholderiaceae bacterium]